MREITYQNIIEILLDKFPEFQQSKYYDESDREFQYATLGSFSRFLLHNIESGSLNQEITERAFKFINQIYNGSQISNEDGSDTLQNLFYVEVFENLTQTKLGVVAARKYLQGKAKVEFETVFQHTGIEEGKLSDY